MAQYRKFSSKKKQKGLTFMESVGALVLTGIVLAGVASVYAGQVDAVRAGTIGDELVQTANDLHKIHSGYADPVRYEGVTLDGNSSLTENLREALNSDGTAINLNWGATLTLRGSDHLGGNTSFSSQLWTVSGLPKRQCEAMLKKVAQSALVVKSGSTIYRNRMANDQLTPVDMYAICASDDSNTFDMVFS